MRYRSNTIWAYPLLVCFLSFLGCSKQRESSKDLLSGVDEHPNACTLMNRTQRLLEPPPVFHRAKGKPVTETLSFSVPLDGELCVVVTNGDKEPPDGRRVSAAWIHIDDELVVGPDRFSQIVDKIQIAVPISAGDHELSVKLASKPGSFLTVDLRLLAGDTRPPVIVLEEPELNRLPDYDGTFSVIRDVREDSVIEIKGKAYDITGVASVEMSQDGTPISVSLKPGGLFSSQATLDTTGQGPFVDNEFVITAVDYLGNTAVLKLVVSVQISNTLPGRILVRFTPNASSDDIENIINSVGGTVLSKYSRTRQYYLAVDPSIDTRMLSDSLEEEVAVYYAMPAIVFKQLGFCSADPGDPFLGTPGQYYLGNDPNFIAFSPSGIEEGEMYEVGIPCDPAFPNDCTNTQETCFIGKCTYGNEVPLVLGAHADIDCTTDLDCQTNVGPDSKCVTGGLCRNTDGELTGTRCANDSECIAENLLSCHTTGLCGKQGGDGYDVGWMNSQQTICDIHSSGVENEVVVAVVEFQYADIFHPDLQPRLWTNFLECRGTQCFGDWDCDFLGPGSRCIRGKNGSACDGPDPDVLPDCEFGDANGDGCPGDCGFDDDLDGESDFRDLEVKNLVKVLCSNKDEESNYIDDDEDGTANDCCLDGTEDVCDPSHPNYPGEQALAAWDDDENGYIDDIHGFDFGRAKDHGHLYGSTHPDSLVTNPFPPPAHGFFHATMVSGAIGAALDNGMGIAGINPAARIMPLGMAADWKYPELQRNYAPAMHYAADHGARIVNISWYGGVPCMQALRCDGILLQSYLRDINRFANLFLDGLSPSMLYVIAAGNDRDDITLAPTPINGQCLSIFGNCYWSFPQNIGTYPSRSGTGTPYNLVIAATNIKDELVDRFAGRRGIGSNVGSTLIEGGCAVDFAAPTDTVDSLTYNEGYIRTAGGTSFAAPVVSGIASILASWEPDLFDGRPTKIKEHLSRNIRPCQPPSGSWRGCEGNMEYEGRVDLYNALNAPLPDYKMFENETWRLSNNTERNTTDVIFFDSDLTDNNRGTTHMVEVSINPPGEEQRPRLFKYYPIEGEWRDITDGRLPDIAGNYSKVEAADFNNDGCTDLVLAGYSQIVDGQIEPVRNRLFFQRVSDNECISHWRDVGDEGVINGWPRLPRFPWAEITTDVDIFDFNEDGLPDILFTNNDFHQFPYWTGDVPFPVVLLINRDHPQQIGSFRDASPRFPDYERPPPGGLHKPPLSSTICDVDQDGDLDVVQTVWEPESNGNYIGSNRLFIYDSNTGLYYERGESMGFPEHSGITSDVACYDITGPPKDGGPTGDGYPEIIFTQLGWELLELRNVFLVNNGRSPSNNEWQGYSVGQGLHPLVLDSTGEVEICNIDDDPYPEIFFSNGYHNDVYLPERNRLLAWDHTRSMFLDKAEEYGFDFSTSVWATEDIDCVDIDGDRRIDAIFIGEYGAQNSYYIRHQKLVENKQLFNLVINTDNKEG